MKKQNILISALLIISVLLNAQEKQIISEWKFQTGDNLQWKEKNFDNNSWKAINVELPWDYQGFKNHEGYGWYKAKFILPSSIRKNSFLKDSIKIYLGKIDECDQTFLNGKLIGQNAGIKTTAFEEPGYAWSLERCYVLSVNNPAINWDKENEISIRVYNSYGLGGMYQARPYINMKDITDYIRFNVTDSKFILKENNLYKYFLHIDNHYIETLSGKLKFTLIKMENQKKVWEKQFNTQIPSLKSYKIDIDIPVIDNTFLSCSFIETRTQKNIQTSVEIPYILTPKVSDFPKLNSAKVFGVRPRHPFVFKVPATGKQPLIYKAESLPNGLSIDKNTGIITGSISEKGRYIIKLIVENNLGICTRDLRIECGDNICLTPPMGWNSWNCWGLSVSEEKVKNSADAMIAAGLINHGWAYINIDDGWELVHKDDSMTCNEKFPDMKMLADYIHAKGLKMGIYSSPGPKTCGGFEGSFNYEKSDALNFAAWGIDYLKYDWCSYESVACQDTDRLIKPYKKMQKALQNVDRDIIYSLCQYGMGEVWKWGATVNGNTWRTTGDITDTWESMYEIGFKQDRCASYSAPGHWNDPDMLVVGKVGWGPALHNTRLTPNEQYTHISLWALLSAPLLIGCDLAQMDDFTLNLLTNDEVIEIDQDTLGIGAIPIVKNNEYQIWGKKLEDGSKVLGIFNLSTVFKKITVNWNDLGLNSEQLIRDVWLQKNLGVFKNSFTTPVPPHGVRLIKITKK